MLNPQTLETFLRYLHITQAFDYRAKQLQKVGIIGTFPSSAGQEHFFLSLAMNMNQDDWYCPYYRDQAALIYRGMPISALFQYWAGDERGNQKIPQNTMPINVPIGSQVPHATGIALALRNTNQISVVTLGDGASSKGEVYESINFAAIHKLPIVFAVNNNKYAISTHIHQHSSNHSIANKFSNIINSRTINTTSPTDVFIQVGDAINWCRTNNEPLLIDVITERIDPHTTNDDATLYRSKNELAKIKTNHPCALLTKELLNNPFSSKQIEQIAQDATAHVEAQATQFLEEPKQDILNLTEYLLEKNGTDP